MIISNVTSAKDVSSFRVTTWVKFHHLAFDPWNVAKNNPIGSANSVQRDSRTWFCRSTLPSMI